MRLGIAGCGVVGRTYAEAFLRIGHTIVGTWDAKPTDELADFARDRRIPLRNEVGAWLGEAELVISAVFGSAALDVARQALVFMRPGTHYIDMTTADPDDMRRAEALAKDTGVHFLDVAITGAVNLRGSRTPLLIAGHQAETAANLYREIGAQIQIVSESPGDASSLKLLRSIFTKGMEALSVECLMTAERRGLRSKLHDVLSDIDEGSLRALMESMVITHIPHASRRQKEVAEVQRQMRLIDIQPLLMPAVEMVFERTVSHLERTPFRGDDIESALAWLSAAAASPVGTKQRAGNQRPGARGDLQ